MSDFVESAIESIGADFDINSTWRHLDTYAAWLAGIEDILDNDELSGDARNVAAALCRQINHSLSKIAAQMRVASEQRSEVAA